jgi:hypothetical protein
MVLGLLSGALENAHSNDSLSPADQWLSEHSPSLLSTAQFDQLYKSLIQGYWVPQSGLFLSFPRTPDLMLTQQAATYDEGIVGLFLLHVGDLDKVRQMLAFYEKAWNLGNQRTGIRQGVQGLANFYNAYYFMEGIEKSIHAGPNAWIGLLASRYYRQTQDPKALQLALDMAHWMIWDLPHRGGAIAMGSIAWNGAPWPQIYSTENNISMHAFFSDLLKVQDLRPWDRAVLETARWRIAYWLTHVMYQTDSKTVYRGYNPQGWDKAGALDSYTWYLCALHPDALQAKGIPVDTLMDEATQKFTGNVGGRPGVDAVDQEMATKTFDEAVARKESNPNLRRPADHHRMIWYEGQGQYIVALQVMAQDAVERAFKGPAGAAREELLGKATKWLQLAALYTQATDRAGIYFPWGRSFPCATQGQYYVYGASAPSPIDHHLADAVAPLVWRLFSGMNYDVLTDRTLKPGVRWQVQPITTTSVDKKPILLYNSSDDMAGQAWTWLNQKNYPLASQQALVTIKCWEKDAQALQMKKSSKVKTFLPYAKGSTADFQRIEEYWALNDVGACYFILGKAADQQQQFAEAQRYFSTVLKDYPLAQVWDPHGWFWSPTDAIKVEYIEVHKDHYGMLSPKIPNFPVYEGAAAHEP